MALIGSDILQAKQLLENGSLVAIPTETVYGLAANALLETAVLSIFETKQRPAFDPLIVHVANIGQVNRYADWQHPALKKLAEAFWPGPLTILLPKKDLVPDLVSSGLPQVAIRVPNHPLTIELLQQLPFPLAAPSANPFGYISPTTAAHVNRQLGQKIPYILDGGPCGIGLESTIVGMEANEIVVYRLGGLSLDAIEKIVGKVQVKQNLSSNPLAPGQLKSHYAPSKQLIIGDIGENLNKHKGKKIAVLSFAESFNATNIVLHLNLSPQGNLEEAALNLFKMLRLADESNADIILTTLLPKKGLGLAINDRLIRAAN